ncbi:MAG TPA: hypothetical protein VFH68_13780 [Polyangia bacterium]|jgi:hypothetical protein|nr:hypothetical protein [Polyangia bacterium]
MGAKTAADIAGLEFDWLASDADGHVALFSTAGGGYAPDGFLRDTERHDVAIGAILAHPESTSARFAPELAPGLKNTWRMVAERGLFAFDADCNGGPYNLVAAPETPARLTELPMEAGRVAGAMKLPHLRFAHAAVLSEDDIRNI